MKEKCSPPKVIIVMGVAGSGKTTIGKALANALGWSFYDGDDFHPPANVAKMAQGIPLDDADRAPWLSTLHDLIATCLANDKPAVLACSALKQRYRDHLLDGNPCTEFVYLRGDFRTIFDRMKQRHGHYMKPEMLQSQFAALEEPTDALTLDIREDVENIVEKIIGSFGLNRPEIKEGVSHRDT